MTNRNKLYVKSVQTVLTLQSYHRPTNQNNGRRYHQAADFRNIKLMPVRIQLPGVSISILTYFRQVFRKDIIKVIFYNINKHSIKFTSYPNL